MNERLIKQGANMNMINCDGYTPLMYLSIRNLPEKLQFLINQGCDLHVQNSCGETALFFASQQKMDENVAIILNAVQDTNDLFSSHKTIEEALYTKQIYEHISRNENRLHEVNLKKWKSIKLKRLFY